MSKVLVLAEKPSVGRDLARVLRCHQKGNGFLEGERYIVTWALGHLVTLAEPEDYDERYKTWRLDDLPLLPSPLKLVVIRQSSKQFQAVKKQLQRQDVKEIVIATDAGREGELVARWILEKARVKKPLKRLWISSVTDKAIREGMSRLRDGREFDSLYASAVARAEADWLVGINATRALTCKYNAQLSCGRVQTPTLAIIAQREEEIRNFQPRPFYGLQAVTQNGIRLTWQDAKTKALHSFSQEKMEAIYQRIQHEDAQVVALSQRRKKSYAPLLYDLTELQREANKRFGFSAKETLSLMQQLYERHKVLTYPRTDSRYLTSDIVETLKDRLKACSVGPYAKLAAKLLRQPLQGHPSFVNDAKVSDHHAIIPTEEPVILANLSERERKIFDLVVRRFFAVLLPPCEYEQITLRAQIGGETFIAKGKRMLSPGWKEAYDDDVAEEEPEDSLEEQHLPEMHEGEKLPLVSLTLTQGETRPPARFTEATLLSAMENPVRYMAGENKDLIKTIGETGGLGTVATRADIIEKLFNTFLIEKKGKEIWLTSKGRQLLDLVPEELKSPALTAKWEQQLGKIAKGALSKDAFIRDMTEYAKAVVQLIKNSEKSFRHDNLTGTRCPQCGQFLLEVNGKKGKMLVCQDRACGYRRHVSQITNARCPQCHKRLELRGEGEGRIFVCSCGYREKWTAFQARKEKENKGKVSKREIAKFLRNQERDLKNPALAEALAKLNLKQK